MTKRVVGYGAMEGDEFCRAKEYKCEGLGKTTVYVSYDEGDMIPSCKICTPAESCEDEISKIFSSVL